MIDVDCYWQKAITLSLFRLLTLFKIWLNILEEEYISFKEEKDRMLDSSVVLKKKTKSKKGKKLEE